MSGPASPASSEESCRFLIVDGHAYAYRAFHAIRSLNSPDGRPTNAIYGFIKMLARMREWAPASHVAVVWDGGLAAERIALLPAYKAQRPPMPESLGEQITGIQGYLEAVGIRSLEHDGVEADDWIATLALAATRSEMPVVIASADKDFMQLVAPGVRLLNPNYRSETLWEAAQVRQKTGVEPSAIVDWLALIGDSVDNIPGVPGVGPKTATDLLSQFGTVDALYRRIEEVTSERHRAALRAAEAIVHRNREMIRLRSDLPLAPDWRQCVIGEPAVEALRALYRQWGFKSLLAALEPQGMRQEVLL